MGRWRVVAPVSRSDRSSTDNRRFPDRKRFQPGRMWLRHAPRCWWYRTAQPCAAPFPLFPAAGIVRQACRPSRRRRLSSMFLIATPRYQSEFEATYQTYLAPRTLSSGIVQSFAGTSQNNTVDTGTILYEYIRSPALLQKLDHDLHLRTYYSNSRIDYLSRLGKRAPFEVFLAYYRSHVTVSEGLGGYLTVDVQAFDPKFAQALARAIVVASDAMTDQITARARSDEIKVAEEEVAREEDRVRRSRMALARSSRTSMAAPRTPSARRPSSATSSASWNPSSPPLAPSLPNPNVISPPHRRLSYSSRARSAPSNSSSIGSSRGLLATGVAHRIRRSSSSTPRSSSSRNSPRAPICQRAAGLLQPWCAQTSPAGRPIWLISRRRPSLISRRSISH